MTYEPPPGGAGWPPMQPQGGGAPGPRPFPAAYPPPAPGAPGSGLPPAPDGNDLLPLPDRPSSGWADNLPEPPPDAQPVLQWGDPTPAPAPPPRPAPPGPLNKLAVATIVLGALGALIVTAAAALVTGALALSRLRKSNERGKGLAVGGMVLAVAWVALAALVYVNVLSQPPLRDGKGVVTRKGDLAVTQLQVGDCIEKWALSTEVSKVTVVPCTTAHDAQVFHAFKVTGTEFPGDGPIRDQASTQCSDKLKTTIKEADRKKIQLAVFKPIAASWKRGEHGVACVAVESGGAVTRSIMVP